MYMDVAGEGTDLTATDHNTFQLDDADQVALQQHMAETRIWGTDLNIQTCLNVFQVFIEYFGVQVRTMWLLLFVWYCLCSVLNRVGSF